MGIVQSLVGGANEQEATPDSEEVTHVGPTSSSSGTVLPNSPPPMPGTFVITHPQPPARTPTTTTPARTPLTSMLSYFLPISTPDLSHTHEHPTPSDHRLSALYLTHLHLPGELVPRILDDAEHWSVCTREMMRQVRVVAGAQPPRRAVHIGARWLNGQEDEDGIREIVDLGGVGGLKEAEGDCWILCSGEIGCVEKWDPVLDRLEKEAQGRGKLEAEKGAAAGTSEHAHAGQTVDGVPTEAVVGTDDGESTEARSEKRDRKGWLRQVKVTTDSKDQGWSTSNTEAYGTYDHSYTWFELSLIRDGKQVEGSRLDIQHNVHAGQYYKKHEVELGPESEFVRMARPGDRVVLWARALYAGWHNNVREASLSIYTTPFPPGG